jgi:hypothetical protein
MQEGAEVSRGGIPQPLWLWVVLVLRPLGPLRGVGVVGCSGGVLLSHDLSVAVPSALEGLASGFGMGPGVSPPL